MIVPFSRRHFLQAFANGFGLLALHSMLAEDTRAEEAGADPLAPKRPHFTPRAKRAIFLLMSGGPSQIDLFDPKPELGKAGKRGLPSQYRFARQGQSGMWFSELLPQLSRQADRLCMINSMIGDSAEHIQAHNHVLNGTVTLRQGGCIGSWAVYGLGVETRNLPGFVVLGVPPGTNGQQAVYESAWLPATTQRALIRDVDNPLPYVRHPRLETELQSRQLAFLRQVNEAHLGDRSEETRLAARIASYERAFQMQTQGLSAFDVEEETAAVKALYGFDVPACAAFSRKLLTARRLLERGVRFVVVQHGVLATWDQHNNLSVELPQNCREVDRPTAGLLDDLRSRGLLEDTLVIWGGEMGRTPHAQGPNGRDHHRDGWTMLLAGGGAKGGLTYGKTDPITAKTIEQPVHVRDLHATILHLLGLDHRKLVYRVGGVDRSLTGVTGNARVVTDILS